MINHFKLSDPQKLIRFLDVAIIHAINRVAGKEISSDLMHRLTDAVQEATELAVYCSGFKFKGER